MTKQTLLYQLMFLLRDTCNVPVLTNDVLIFVCIGVRDGGAGGADCPPHVGQFEEPVGQSVGRKKEKKEKKKEERKKKKKEKKEKK